jgi:hypothetical protein
LFNAIWIECIQLNLIWIQIPKLNSNTLNEIHFQIELKLLNWSKMNWTQYSSPLDSTWLIMLSLKFQSNTSHLKSTWWYNNVSPILQMNYITWKNQHSKIHIKWDVIYIHLLVCVEPKTCNNNLNMLFEMVGWKLLLFIHFYAPSSKEFLYKLPYDLYLYSWIW